ncbi:hypothetical protein ABB37_07317 [Leptomonas pyrrhocoris]|uniref:Uncharacterized protein n=1 Tax=Leptomonas pyrrhocoris TaxID=157538 RepID=A0A0N0DT38_LEPPY|nr:hypothetical protein ABB37_07317 [Leptomonas pyrrhocoris]KPA76938.1 hypothetical protein ABB37_07317 [Leptomonas pyrrhocoris]|eukprot:XP_015655377.1 hypothetical protein ABB37_07317 [Leptomonas pyrrhocoris]
MVYKPKNNKWSRMLAARKLAAAERRKEVEERHSEEAEADAAFDRRDEGGARDAAATAHSKKDGEGRLSDSADAPTSTGVHQNSSGPQTAVSIYSTGSIGPQEQSENDCCTAHTEHTPLLTRLNEPPACGESTCVLRDIAQLPRVVDAFCVPSPCFEASLEGLPAVSDAPIYIAYTLQMEASAAREAATVFGVWDARSDGGCLQLVRWSAEAHPAAEPPLPLSSTTSSSGLQELVMYVDAEGRCFMLAPSSVVSVGQADISQKGEESTVDQKMRRSNDVDQSVDGGVEAAAPVDEGSPYAYWLIPAFLKDHFMALLLAQRRWHVAGSAGVKSESLREPLPSFAVQPHASQWILTSTAAAAHEDRVARSVDEAASVSAPPAQLAPSPPLKVGRKKKKAEKRRRAATTPPQSDPVIVNAEAAPSQADVSATYRIPYVVKVTRLAASAGDASTDEGATSSQLIASRTFRLPSSAVFYVGNRLTPFPPDYVLQDAKREKDGDEAPRQPR